MDNIVVITIIAVFWLSGLLMTWSMCIVSRHEPTGVWKSADADAGRTTPATGNSGDASPPVSPS